MAKSPRRELFPVNPILAELERQIACVKREIAFRESCYPSWVKSGKMTKEKADDELGTMRRVLGTLKTVAANTHMIGKS